MYRSLKCLALVSLLSAPDMVAASQWAYSTTHDELRNADTTIAHVEGVSTTSAVRSTETPVLKLLLRRAAQGDDAYFMLSSGDLSCTPRRCHLTARLDDGQVMAWDASPGKNSNVIFLNSPKVFAEALRLGKRLIVEVAVDGTSVRQFAFDVQNLNWPSALSPKSAPTSIGGIDWAAPPPSDHPPFEESQKANTRCYAGPAPTESPWNAVSITKARYCFVNNRFISTVLESKQGTDAQKKLLDVTKQFFGKPEGDSRTYFSWPGLDGDKTVRAALYPGTKAKDSSLLMIFYEPLEPYVVWKEPQ